MKKNVKFKTVVLMIMVMGILTACDGKEASLLPTSVAEDTAETLETTETTEADESVIPDDTIDALTGMAETETDAAEEESDLESEATGTETETAEDESVTETVVETDTDGGGAGAAAAAGKIQPEVQNPPVSVPVQEEAKPVHTHSYTGSVAANPTCEGTGIMAYACACGDSYTEPIAAAGHQWTTTTETVHHPSLGHMERTEKKVFKLRCGCGAIFTTNEDFDNHRGNELHGNKTACVWEETVYEDNWVVTQEEWDETVTKNVCAVCGMTQ